MPHDALNAAAAVGGRRPDVVLGDRFGVACDRWLIDAAAELFAAAGFVVARNAPFAGGYITQTYGRPQQGIHALQIEIDRALYMDEAAGRAARPTSPRSPRRVARRTSPGSPPSARRPPATSRSPRRNRAASQKKEAVHEARPKFREETPVGRV